MGYDQWYMEIYINLLLRGLHDDHVASFLGYGVAGDRFVLFFEDEAMLAQNRGTSLVDFMESAQSYSNLSQRMGMAPADPEATKEAHLAWAARVFQAISEKAHKGLDRLHKIGIVHGDVTVQNFILTRRGQIKFIDFGHS